LRLGPFRMDSHLFRGKNGQPERAISRDEAETLCATKQGRLCSEAEWERACRGPSSTLYPSGETPCAGSGTCRSGFDVFEMTQSLEWTASTFGRDSAHTTEPVVRGALTSTPADQRRCAARRFADKKPDTAGGAIPSEIGFRCCYGAPNASTIREPSLGPAYQRAQLSVTELRALLRSDPRTAPYADEAQFFKAEAAATVLARGPGDSKGFTLTTEPLLWQPSTGTTFLVVVAHDSHRTSFVVVYYDYNNERKLAGSFIMEREPGPVALAYAESIRPRLHMSTCFGCPGETGKVLFREPEEVVLLQP
ncbi:MAG TPA: SUMF1/EgtB/PvdO family nonheme iron enzyme, partial [Polyangiaceae bacterium]|nr:SUMF1/EgtB/PvdO family nonheme iron enzyme [Polyangiaceae bacterium]